MDDPDWHWGICNRGPEKLLIWLEPWAEEFDVPAGSSLTLKLVNEPPAVGSFEIDEGDQHLIVWVDGGGTAEISIDGVIQDSGSAAIAFTALAGLSTKTILGTVFQNAPTARLGGRQTDVPTPPALLGKIRRWLGLPH